MPADANETFSVKLIMHLYRTVEQPCSSVFQKCLKVIVRAYLYTASSRKLIKGGTNLTVQDLSMEASFRKRADHCEASTLHSGHMRRGTTRLHCVGIMMTPECIAL